MALVCCLDVDLMNCRSASTCRELSLALFHDSLNLDSGVRSNELEVSASVSKAYGMLRTSQLGEPL